MSKNNRVIIFSLTVAAIIAIFLFIIIFAILYFYWGDETAIKDALSTTGSFFGGFATLGTAVVASFLFNDWKLQHNQQAEKEFIIDINNLHNNLNDFIFEKQADMHKAMNIYKYVGTNLPTLHNELIFEVYLLHNSLLKYLVNFKIRIQNYGLISKNTKFTKEIISKISEIEEMLEKKFQPIKDLKNNEIPSNLLNASKVYNNYASEELSATLYEIAIDPLIKKIPA